MVFKVPHFPQNAIRSVPDSKTHNIRSRETFEMQHITRFDIVLNVMFLLGTVLLFYFVMANQK
jgi:hypothetical protein